VHHQFIPLIGHFPVIVTLHKLNRKNLVKVLQNQGMRRFSNANQVADLGKLLYHGNVGC